MIRSSFIRREGNVSVLFAMGFLPVVLLAGSAIDFTRAIVWRGQAANALDAAGLAAAKTFVNDKDTLETVATAFLEANLDASALAHVKNLKVEPDGLDSVVLTADVHAPTTFLSASGVEDIVLPIRTVIARSVKEVEIALVLDNTGSMNGSGKIGALRDAARSLTTSLYGDDTESDVISMAVVPYVTAVNIKAEGFDMAWMDEEAQSTHHGENFDPPANHFDLFDTMGEDWKGCVEMRAAPYDATDDPPTDLQADTLFTPYLWPDEPDGSNFHNDYIYDDEEHCDACDGLSGKTLQAAQIADVAKYDEGIDRLDDTPSNTYGPNKSCARPIVPLTNKRDTVVNEINAMKAWNGSGTNAAAGLVWGWRVLSPTPPFTEGVPYENDDVIKAMVLMTDGENIIYGGWDEPTKSNYSSYGYLSEERLGTDSKNSAKTEINKKMSTLCTNIKNAGIQIYTVTFKQNSKDLKNLYRDCASEPEFYFDATSNQLLVEHFLTIAGELSQLRIAG